ncbi:MULTISPECIES: hypothetical protein [Paraburkholderia]|uniref:Uncharacterized protein n=1 Tax=Paraburkholderia unamae TaxID=219649 RepID=A0ACC6RDI4_9BURK
MRQYIISSFMAFIAVPIPQMSTPPKVSLVYPSRRHVPAKTRSFVGFHVKWFHRRQRISKRDYLHFL